MRRIGWTWGILAGLLVAAPVMAQQHPMGRGGGGRHGGGPGGFWDACLASPELGLTADQKARLDALRVAGRQEASAHREAIHSLRQEWHQALLDPRASPEEIRGRAKALHEAMDQARERMLDRILEARAVLTPAQIGKMSGLPACQKPRFRGPPGGPGALDE